MRNSTGVALLTGAAVAMSAALAWRFIGLSAPTYDEPVHLAAGYVALASSVPPLHDRDHGPLIEAWDALPLLWLKPALLWGDPAWGRLYRYGNAFLYRNRSDADKMLQWARLWSLLTWTTALAPPLALWSLRLGGWPAACASVAMLAFCPLWLSSAGLVATDAGSTTLFFLTFWILSSPQRSWRRWLAAGATAGLAIAGKYNMAVIPPLAACAWLTDLRLSKQKGEWQGPLLMAAACFVVVVALYLGRLDFFLKILVDSIGYLNDGRPSFLWGRYSTQGWLWYFPLALAVKTPLPLLIASAAGLVFAGKLASARERVWLLLGPIVYFAAACRSHTQIGVRHLLPLFPFLIVLGSCAAAWAWRRARWGKAAVLALGAWLAVGTLRCEPYLLEYFNEAAGGPGNGWRFLADSNLDWGQGLKELGMELRRRGEPPVFLSYFGVADPRYYGIRYRPIGVITNAELPGTETGPLKPGEPVLLAISQTNLQGVYFQDHAVFEWLRARKPAFQAGQSLLLYDLTGDADGRRRLSALLGAPDVVSL